MASTSFADTLGKRRAILALTMFGDAAVSFALNVEHLQDQFPLAFLLFLFALFQMILAFCVLVQPNRQIFGIVYKVNFLCAIGLMLWYTVGLPVGLHPWTPQVFGTAELSALFMTLMVAVRALGLHRSWNAEEHRKLTRSVLASVPAVLIIFLLTWIGVVSVINAHPPEMNMSAPTANGTMDMSAHGGSEATPMTSLVEPPGNQPIKEFTLIAEQKVINGNTMWAYNGTVPGPEIRVKQRDRLKVTLINHLPVATSIHWHGIRLPNAEDGVAGVTQDAVQPASSYTYEFVVKDVGTFMYHSHQDTWNQMLKGLFGALVVESPSSPAPDRDYALILHESPGGNSFGPGLAGYLALGKPEATAFNGQIDDLKLEAKPGERVRLRLIGAIQGEPDGVPNYMIAAPREIVLLGAEYQIASIDGNDINEPQTIGPVRIRLGIGQRYDVVFSMPQSGQVRLIDTNGHETVTIGSGSMPQTLQPNQLPLFDITNYGNPTLDTILAPKNGQFDVDYPLVLGFRSGLREDRPELVHTINDNASPMMTQYIVKKGQLVHFHIINKTEEFHVIHLHGHTFTVTARDGHPLQGSPIHMDSLLVAPFDNWDIAFVADNPGLWMIHCHVLIHAAFGMSAMVSYEGITTPYTIGDQSGNKPE